VRTLSRRERGLLALVALGAALLLLQRFNNPAGTPAARARTEPLPPPLARIDLARLSAERPDSGAGERDLFRFGSAARHADDEDELPVVHVPVSTPPVGLPGDGATAPGQATSLPPLNLKYLGSVENRAGVKVAVLLTDRKEVLTGQAGETLANRYRIARIGLESVDLEDIASGQSRRIPLRGN
jgi:hypothetical protein